MFIKEEKASRKSMHQYISSFYKQEGKQFHDLIGSIKIFDVINGLVQYILK